MKRTALVKRKSKSNFHFSTKAKVMTDQGSCHNSFAVCIENSDYTSSLEVGKLYQIISDAAAESHGYLRVIDESGGNYGYSKNRFVFIQIPIELEQVLLKVA